MKRKFPLIGCYMIAILLACVCFAFTTVSCDHIKWQDGSAPEARNDSVLFAQYIDHVTNPTFLTCSEVIDYKLKSIENAEIDSFIKYTPESVLRNVAGVVIKQRGNATAKQIMMEYKYHRQIYENLPANDTSTAPQSQPTAVTTQMEAMQTRAVTTPSETITSSEYRDTMIDGKKYRIETKTVRYD